MSSVKQYVTFYFDEKLYGIDIRVVNEVNPRVKIMPVPLSEPYIRGLVNIRGQVILVMDFMIVLGKKQRVITPDSHIVILKTIQDLSRINGLDKQYNLEIFGNKPVGFLVDNIGDVVIVNEDQVEHPTQNVDNINTNFFEGVVKLEHDLLIIMNPEKLLTYNGETVNSI